MPDRIQAKAALDAVIRKSRIHLYKPIQIAEILYRDRVFHDINLLQLEDYRSKSRHWRDDVCRVLLGRVCTSSAKFQDDLFNETAIPPVLMHLSTKIGHKTKKIRHKKRIDVQDSSTFLTSFKLVRQTMPSIMQTRSADGRVTFPILLRRQVA